MDTIPNRAHWWRQSCAIALAGVILTVLAAGSWLIFAAFALHGDTLVFDIPADMAYLTIFLPMMLIALLYFVGRRQQRIDRRFGIFRE